MIISDIIILKEHFRFECPAGRLVVEILEYADRVELKTIEDSIDPNVLSFADFKAVKAWSRSFLGVLVGKSKRVLAIDQRGKRFELLAFDGHRTSH